MEITANLEQFYIYFPEFNTEAYQPTVEVWFNETLDTAQNWNLALWGKYINKGIYLLTAHICKLRFSSMNGQSGQGGQVASATVDGVTVSFNNFQSNRFNDYYLTLTPYGLELLNLINLLTGNPKYFGGSFERVF